MPDNPLDPLSELTDPNRAVLSDPRVSGFLSKIGQSEGADYNTLVGGRKINDLSRHPNVVGLTTSAGPSTAFGKYQITNSTHRSKLAKYSSLDYSPENQDVRAVELLRQTGALNDILNDDPQSAVKKAGREWASLPGSTLPGRKNYAAFKEQDPLTELTKPQKVQPQADPLTELTQPEPHAIEGSGRGAAMARTTQTPPITSLRGTKTRPMVPKGWGGAGTIGEGVNETQQPATAVRSMMTRPAPVRASAGRSAFALTPEEQMRTTPPGTITPTTNKLVSDVMAQKDQADTASKGLSNIAAMGGVPTSLLPKDAEDWINATVAQGGSGLLNTAAGLVRHGVPALDVAKMFGAPDLLQKPIADKLQAASVGLGQASQAIDRNADRGVISQGAKDVVGGGIATTPAMLLMSLGIPAPVAFGMQSSAEAQGRDADLVDTIKETTKGATIGALFELPLPSRVAMAGQLGQRLAKAGIVGAGTKAIDLASGSDPNNLSSPIVNALFAFSGAPKTESPEIGSSKPASIAPVIADARAERVMAGIDGAQPANITPAQPGTAEAVKLGGAQGRLRTLPQTNNPIVAGTAQAEPLRIERPDTEGAKLNRWQHSTFGLVTESADQSRVPRGRVRVIDQDGAEHVIQRANGRGEGNQIAVPIREKPDTQLADEAAQAQENAPFKVIDRRGGNEGTNLSAEAYTGKTAPPRTRSAAVLGTSPPEVATRNAIGDRTPEISSVAAQVEQASQPAEVTPQIVKPWEMTRDQIEEGYQRKKSEDDNLEASILGPELAKRYAQLQRSANSSYDIEKANRASDEIEKIEASLSETDRNRLYGIGEEGPQADELKAYRQPLGNLDDSSPQALAESMRWAITQVGREVDPTKMRPEQQVAYGTLREAARIAHENGWDTQAISREAVKAAAGRFSDPEDAAFMLDRFIKKETKSAELEQKQITASATISPTQETKGEAKAEPKGESNAKLQSMSQKGLSLSANAKEAARVGARDTQSTENLRTPDLQSRVVPPPSSEGGVSEAKLPELPVLKNGAPKEVLEARLGKAANVRAHVEKLESAGVEVPKESKPYAPTTNIGDVDRANAIIDKEGLDSVVERIKKGDVEEGAIRSTLADVTQKRLIDEANKTTDPAEKLRRFGQSIDIAAADLPRTTKVAQELQAMGTIDKLSPDGSIKEAQRIVSSFDPNAKLDPARAKVFVDHANELAAERKTNNDLRAWLLDAQKNPTSAEKPPTKAQARKNVTREKTQKAVDYLTAMEVEAQARLHQAFGGATMRAGIDPLILKDLGIVGAAKIARGTVDVAAWSEEMARDFGEKIKPHLDEIRKMAVSLHKEAKDKFKETKLEQQDVRRAEMAGLSPTPENIAKVRQEYQDHRTRERMAQRNLEREYRDLQDEQRSKAGLIATALNRNGLLSIKGFLNIAQALTGKSAKDALSNMLAEPREAPTALAKSAFKLPEAAKNFGLAFLGKDSPVMKYWGSKTFSDPRADLGINVMTRLFGAKESFKRTFDEEFEMQRSARLLARLDVQSGTIKRGQKMEQIERYLNEGVTPGPKAQEWIDSKALKAARYEAKKGSITDKMIDVRSEDLSKDVPKLLGVLREQYADRAVSGDPSITAKEIRRRVPQTVQEIAMPFQTRPIRSVVDWLGTEMGTKLVFGSDPSLTNLKEMGKHPIRATLQGDIYKAIESKVKTGKIDPNAAEELRRTLSRSATNYAGLVVLGAVLAKNDLLDEDGKIHGFGRTWNVGDIPFLGWSLTFGAGWQKNGSKGALKAVGKVIGHHPLLRGVTDLAENINAVRTGDSRALPAAERYAGSLVGRFIPHPLPDIAEAMSTKERTSPGFTGPMLYRIPYMRDKLDPRLTPMGEEIPKSRLSVIDPYRSQPDLRSQWPLSKDLEPAELQRPPQRMTKVNETSAEYLQRQKTEGPAAKQALQELANDPEYYKLTKAQQRKARVKVELEARKGAREYLPAPQRRIVQREAQQ